MIIIPNYIRKSGIIDEPIRHSWDDDDPESLYPPDERVTKRLGGICDRGVVAISAGFAEWIAWRLSKHCTDPILLQEIEAVWAGIVDWRYAAALGQSAHAPDDEHWKGPIRGPVSSAFFDLSQIVALAKRSSYIADDSSSLSKLALYVMPDPKPFKEWRRFAIERLSKMYPLNRRGNSLGPPIPREALSPDIDYRPEMAKDLLSNYLKTLDHEKNPFLRSPKDLIADGFRGEPYKL